MIVSTLSLRKQTSIYEPGIGRHVVISMRVLVKHESTTVYIPLGLQLRHERITTDPYVIIVGDTFDHS